jgi:hypothetical protein
MGIIEQGKLISTTATFLRAEYVKIVTAVDSAIKSPEAAILRERAIKITAATIINAERAINAVAIIIARERVLKAITVTITLLIIALALPAIY